MARTATVSAGIAAAGVIVLGMAWAGAASAQMTVGDRIVTAGPAELSARAQARPKAKARARAHIRVTPAYPYRLESLPFPTPYDVELPGPNAVRQCTSWLEPERRPSGTVIVPRMRCWWQRG